MEGIDGSMGLMAFVSTPIENHIGQETKVTAAVKSKFLCF